MNDDSVIHAVKLLYPKLEHQLLLAKQVALIEPLKAQYIYEDSKTYGLSADWVLVFYPILARTQVASNERVLSGASFKCKKTSNYPTHNGLRGNYLLIL